MAAAASDVFTRSAIMATLLLAMLLASTCTTTDAEDYQENTQCYIKCRAIFASCYPDCSKKPAQTSTCMKSCISNGIACAHKCKGPGRYDSSPSYNMPENNNTAQIGN
ncbi:hypothetical protein FRX31_020227 [Thalictrum thalictroides]|uniref:Thionin-like protein n=1 Tax=Thalictrum thalictroides TaxID=46969 RepID=A0A7J6VYI2_THATH|nr:hypothetical protein FRX31_020227 [Thalictrum thalictroides]